MHILKLFSILFLSLFLNLRCTKYTPPDYCTILKSDQSNVFVHGKTPAENEASLKKRKEIFLENFDLIIKETNRNGFPKIVEDDKLRDSCKYWAITATLIHIGQTRPDILFSEEIINLFSTEINADRMDNDVLYTTVNMRSSDRNCDTLKSSIEKAITLWKLDPVLKDQYMYIKCDE